METFLQSMPTNTDKKDCLKSEDIKLSLKLSKMQEIKGESGLVGKQAVDLDPNSFQSLNGL